MKRETDNSKQCTVKRNGAQCGLTDGHDGFHLFFCSGPHCPGYPLPASELPHPSSCVTGNLVPGDFEGAIHNNCIEILSKFPKPGTEVFECPLCGNRVQRLFIALEGDEDSEVSYEVCSSCYEDIEGAAPDRRTRFPPMEEIVIRMDSRMKSKLDCQSQIEGFLDLSVYLHTIIFREAVKIWLEDMAEPETVEEQTAFVQEMRDWLRAR